LMSSSSSVKAPLTLKRNLSGVHLREWRHDVLSENQSAVEKIPAAKSCGEVLIKSGW